MAEEKRIKSMVAKERKVYTVHPQPGNCPLSPEEGDCLCCVYTENHNLHVCPYSGEEVRIDGGKSDTGLATSYCTYPEVNEELGFHF